MNRLAKSAILLMIITMGSKVIGFIREIVLVYFYGTSVYSDAYITAMNIPTVLLAAIGAALATTFIPLYQEAIENGGHKRALKFSNNIVCIVIIISIILSITGYIFAKPLVKLFAIDFEGEKLQLTIQFVRIMMVGCVCIALSNIMTSYLQIKGEFIIPGMTGFPYNIIIIISIVLSVNMDNIYILAIGALIAMITQFMFQVPFAIKKGYKFDLKLDMSDQYIKKMIWLLGPVFIGVGTNQINTMIDRSLASSLGDGIITALNSANRLNGFVMSLCITTIGAVIYPTLSKISSENDKEKFSQSVISSVNSVTLLVLPATVGAIALSTPIVQILFERGAFDERSTYLTSTALVFYSIGMIGVGLRDILDKVFYSLKDTRTPMINGIIAMILNIVLNIILVKIMGHTGLALSTSLSSIICVFMLFKSLQSKIGYFGQDKITITFFKSLIASIFMGCVVKLTYNFFNSLLYLGAIKEIISLIVSILMGITVYIACIIILKVKEIDIVTSIIKDKINVS